MMPGSPTGAFLDHRTRIGALRERLKHLNRVQVLFHRFHPQLAEQGYAARAGQMTGAAFVEVLRQRNSREDNSWIKTGETPVPWTQDAAKPMLRQKDLAARWPGSTKRTRQPAPTKAEGYKNPINADQAHQRVQRYRVTDDSVHDSPVFGVLRNQHTGAGRHKRPIYADSTYRPKAQPARLAAGFPAGSVGKAHATLH